MRSSGAAGSIRPKPLKPGRPLVAGWARRVLEQQSRQPPLGQPQQEHHRQPEHNLGFRVGRTLNRGVPRCSARGWRRAAVVASIGSSSARRNFVGIAAINLSPCSRRKVSYTSSVVRLNDFHWLQSVPSKACTHSGSGLSTCPPRNQTLSRSAAFTVMAVSAA